jgi:tetratricopeptide (TPR) repeat protein
MEKKLSEEIGDKLDELCAEGDDLAEDERFDDAIAKYSQALALLPSDKRDWEASTWIYTALGDVCFLKEDYAAAKNYLFDAMNCPDGISNGFVCLRLGETCAELGEMTLAKENLLKAYMIEGKEIFDDEDDKYFEIIKSETKNGKKK